MKRTMGLRVAGNRLLRVLAAGIIGVHGWAESRPLTLEECVESAFNQNPGLILAQDEVNITQARSRVATVALLPALTAKADETRGKATNTEADDQPFLQRSYGFQATQTLFAGWRLSGTHQQSTLASEVARLQLDRQRLDVRHAVTEAYWRVAALTKALAVHRETHTDLQEDLQKAVRHELSSARSARIELLSTRAEFRESEAVQADLEKDLIEARMALLDAMGQRVSTNIQSPDDIPAGDAAVNEEEAIKIARANRPDIKIADYLMESARLGRVVGRSGYYPKVDLNGFYGRSGAAYINTEPFQYRKDWNVGVTASLPIGGNSLKYTGFREQTSPKLGESTRTETDSQTLSFSLGDALGVGVTNRESKKSFHEEEWRYEKARRDMENEVRLAVKAVETSRRRREAARAHLEQADQEFKDTRSLLREDRAHLGDMAKARNRMAFADALYARARAQYLADVSALNRAVGVANHYRIVQP